MRQFVQMAVQTALFFSFSYELAQADPNAAELTKFQGEWVIVSFEYADYELKGTTKRPLRVSIRENEMVFRPAIDVSSGSTLSFGTSGVKSKEYLTFTLSKPDEHLTFQLDPAKTPAEIDLEEKEVKKVVLRKGIYRLRKDQLELCISFQSFDRPTEFEASNTVMVLRLQRKIAEPREN